ncbi:hypothetical protein PSH03_005408 [Micromonospora sp. PSH03]|uniref:hypothetical protein n=1 Tax=Micromonospora salmantinae TaxID=2911211 RepID=UPI001EE89759|nr:hypothetical protein [Micromonospora salmantinae]MCG5459624.1 hypothetical protein [Micromonospora salmantinae]
MTTRTLEVKSALKTIADGMPLVDADRVQVTYGFPVRDIERRWVGVGAVSWDSVEWKTNRSREERFRVAVVFSVQVPGGTSQEAEAYALLMASDFETAVSADPSIGGVCVTSTFSPRSLRSWPITEAYEAQFETEVTAVCRP